MTSLTCFWVHESMSSCSGSASCSGLDRPVSTRCCQVPARHATRWSRPSVGGPKMFWVRSGHWRVAPSGERGERIVRGGVGCLRAPGVPDRHRQLPRRLQAQVMPSFSCHQRARTPNKERRLLPSDYSLQYLQVARNVNTPRKPRLSTHSRNLVK